MPSVDDALPSGRRSAESLTQRRRVFTVGHSARRLDEVVAMLRANGVTHLVDVRSYPASRKYPQWNREDVQAALSDDITYRWLRELGGRRHTPAGVPTPNTGWRVKAFRDYADYMVTPQFQDGLRELLSISATGVPAIMCSEALPWRCHRRLITDALIVAGVDVFDIFSSTSIKAATLNPLAHVADDGHITYPQPRECPPRA